MNKTTPVYKKSSRGRLPHSVPVDLINEIHAKCERHLPSPKKRVFFEFIVTMGLDAFEKGTDPTASFIGRSKKKKGKVKLDRFNHYIDIEVVNRFNKIHASHEPPAIVRGFFELILNLGVQAYEREYTIYGFKKD